MVIKVFGKKGCGICDAAKGKLRLLGLSFTEHDLAERLVPHEGWRADGTAAVMAAYAVNNLGVPIILIDDEAYSYSGAMRRLRSGSG